jgi:hypothetical protein
MSGWRCHAASLYVIAFGLALSCPAGTIRTETSVNPTPFTRTLDCSQLGGERGEGFAHWAGSCSQPNPVSGGSDRYSGEAWAVASAFRVEAMATTWATPGASPGYVVQSVAQAFLQEQVVFLGGIGRGQVFYDLSSPLSGNAWLSFAGMGFRCTGSDCTQTAPAEIEFNVPFLLTLEAEAFGSSMNPGLQRAAVEIKSVRILSADGQWLDGARLESMPPNDDGAEVPEPAVWALTALGLIALALLSRRPIR